MAKYLIDSALFAEGIEPWPNQVFQKDFDAYFFLSYPAYWLIPNDFNIFDPFDLMNNLGEKTINVNRPKGKSNLIFSLNSDWNRQLYYDAYQQNFTDERFLFWQSENEKWAMVSDEKNIVAIIGIDWNISDQVPYFFANCLLSTAQFLQKVGKEAHEAIFLKNYKPASVLIEGSNVNPIWVKYYFQCHVENENDKIFYWPQFEQIYNVIYPVLKHFKSLDMYADQAFTRRYWMNKQWYSSGKNAPVGGWQKYSFANCEKVANKFLNDNEHLRLAFEGKREESEALYIANKNGLIEFYIFWIYASLEKVAQKGGKSDFYFQTTIHSFGNKNDKFNQNFEFCYQKNLLNDEVIEDLVNKLAQIGFAIKIHKLQKPYKFVTFTSNAPLKIECMYDALPSFNP
jgi:hypothetical protein